MYISFIQSKSVANDWVFFGIINFSIIDTVYQLSETLYLRLRCYYINAQEESFFQTLRQWKLIHSKAVIVDTKLPI